MVGIMFDLPYSLILRDGHSDSPRYHIFSNEELSSNLLRYCAFQDPSNSTSPDVASCSDVRNLFSRARLREGHTL